MEAKKIQQNVGIFSRNFDYNVIFWIKWKFNFCDQNWTKFSLSTKIVIISFKIWKLRANARIDAGAPVESGGPYGGAGFAAPNLSQSNAPFGSQAPRKQPPAQAPFTSAPTMTGYFAPVLIQRAPMIQACCTCMQVHINPSIMLVKLSGFVLVSSSNLLLFIHVICA